MERVGERPRDLGEELQPVDRERGLAALGLRRLADGADEVAEVEVDGARALGLAEELDPPGAVDEVEEDELPVPAASHDAPGETTFLAAFLAGLEQLRLGPDRRDLVAVGKALGKAGHGRRV